MIQKQIDILGGVKDTKGNVYCAMELTQRSDKPQDHCDDSNISS